MMPAAAAGGGGAAVFFSVASTHSFRCSSDCVVTYNINHGVFPPGSIVMAKGTFVAPTPGFYLFQFHAMVEPKSLAKVQVKLLNAAGIHSPSQID